jgi:hypothetical protein
MQNTRQNPNPSLLPLNNNPELLLRNSTAYQSACLSNLTASLNTAPPRPGEFVLTASKTIAKLIDLTPPPQDLTFGSTTLTLYL